MRNEYTKINIIDLEATCWATDQEKGSQKQEIIQIGLAEFDQQTFEYELFSYYIKPQYSTVSQYCVDLTGITSDTLKDSPNYKTLWPEIREKHNLSKRVWMSWGDWDKKMFAANHSIYHLSSGMNSRHLNLKLLVTLMKGLPKEFGESEAGLQFSPAITFEGSPHNALNDVRHSAKMYKQLRKLI